MTLEVVHSVYDFYDCPRAGAAYFKGRPHWYQAVFDEASDEWSGEFDLTPLSDVAMAAEAEATRVFEEWLRFESGPVGDLTHPRQVQDPEFMRLRAIVEDELRSTPIVARMRGRFERDRKSNRYVVEWTAARS